jgi:uncharacterized RDD family membrane protein YckC
MCITRIGRGLVAAPPLASWPVVPRLDRIAFAPVRAAGRSSRRLLADEAQRMVQEVLAGDLPETVSRSVTEHHVIERVTPTLEEIVAGVLRSPAFRAELYDLVASAELRRAAAKQGMSFADEVASSIRHTTKRADDATDARIRPNAIRAPRTAGPWTRAFAFMIDVALAQTVFLGAAALIAILSSVVAPLRGQIVVLSLAGVGWLLVETVYFVGFWSGVGQTPGMRLLRIEFPRRLSPARALVRFVALLIAILPLCAGLLPVLFDRRRRGIHDMLASTTVVAKPAPAASVAASPG